MKTLSVLLKGGVGTLLLLLGGGAALAASGIFRDGVGARPMALGGADVGWAEGPLSAFAANPAGAGWLEAPRLDLGLTGVIPEGRFSNVANDDAPLRSSFGVLPDAAFGLPLGHRPVGLFVGFVPEAALSADWRYVDAPGGADGRTTYGLQPQKSEIILLRSGVGLGWAVTPKVSLGGSFGLIYNNNTLETTYVFQTQPALRGAKTLLDLRTDGFGVDGQVGLLFRPVTNLQVGLAYKTPSSVDSHGHASGNAGVQFANIGLGGARPDFHYDAEVDTEFPQIVSGGVFWQAHPRWRLLAQVDWINWSDAFDQLPVILTHGNNADLNGVVGSSTLRDTIPLDWRDQFVYRAGVEFAVLQNLALRVGYSYGRNPVPAGTLTPLTAAIMEHTFTTGLGWRVGRFQMDFAYQYDIPNTVHVGRSSLLSGEYSNSTTEVALHWLALTVSTRF